MVAAEALTRMIPHDVLTRMIPGSTWPPLSREFKSPTGKAWMLGWDFASNSWMYFLVHAGDDWDGHMRRDGTHVVEGLTGEWWIVPGGPYTRLPAIYACPDTGDPLETAEQAIATADAHYRIY